MNSLLKIFNSAVLTVKFILTIRILITVLYSFWNPRIYHEFVSAFKKVFGFHWKYFHILSKIHTLIFIQTHSYTYVLN